MLNTYVDKNSTASYCTISDSFFEHYTSFQSLYRASLEDDFSGVGIVNLPYDRDSLDRDIRSQTNYFADNLFGDIREIKYIANQSHSIAEGNGPHPLHTDASFSNEPLQRFLLSFSVTDPEGGGLSTIFPTQWILDVIPIDYRIALEEAAFSYTRKSKKEGDQTYTGPILSWLGVGRPVFRWRYDELVKPNVVDSKGYPASDAVEWVKRFIDSTPPLMYSAKVGDTLLIDNGKVLHGRTALSPDSSRSAYRAWLC